MNTHSVSPLRALTAALVLALGFSAAGTAEAGPRTRIGVWVGAPWAFGPGYWGPGYGYGYGGWGYGGYGGYGYGGYYGYAPPPTVIVTPAPSTNNVAPAVAQQAQSWYYCQASQMYYPHVRDCAGGWQEVPVAAASTSTAPSPATSSATTPGAAGTPSEQAPARTSGTPVPRAPAPR